MKKSLTTLVAAFLLLFVTVGQSSAQPNYDCGTYGASSYNENCPTTNGGGSSSSSGDGEVTTVEDGEKIVLNEFEEYLTTEGKDIELKTGQIVYFNVLVGGVSEEHYVLLKEVGSNYVILTISSTPTDVRVNVGQTIQYDVTDDGKPDIEIRLNSITDGVADLTFRQFSQVNTNLPERETKKDEAEEESSSIPWILIVVVSVLVGLGVLWFLLSRRSDEYTPGPH